MQETHDSTIRVATTAAAPEANGHRPDPAAVAATISKRSFATLATVSPAGRPHVAGVLYEQVGSHLFVSTLRSSRKARNVVSGGWVGVCIPIRRLPVGPPSTVQFQGRADVLAVDDPVITALLAEGRLKSITGHDEIELPGSCFLRVEIPRRLLTYGLGMSLRTLITDPLGAGGVVETGVRS